MAVCQGGRASAPRGGRETRSDMLSRGQSVRRGRALSPKPPTQMQYKSTERTGSAVRCKRTTRLKGPSTDYATCAAND